MPARQIDKPKISDSNADKMFDEVSNGFKHATNLPIDTLPQNNALTRCGDGVKPRNCSALAIERNSAQQFRSERRIPRTVQRDLILLIYFMTRMSEPLRQFAIVRQKKQTFTLRVETPDVEESRKFLG